jgi:pantoate--beta-alanine ligase
MAGPAPDIVRTVAALRERVRRWRKQSVTVGLVPTMGALHEGHLSLVRRCLAENVRAVVSIFVNPAQFAPHEDFASYPRDESADTEILGALGAHLVFAPDRPEMYAEDFATAFEAYFWLKKGVLSYDDLVRDVAGGVTKVLSRR